VILADWGVGSFDCKQYTTVVETEVCAKYNEKCILCWMMKLYCRHFTPSTLMQN